MKIVPFSNTVSVYLYRIPRVQVFLFRVVGVTAFVGGGSHAITLRVNPEVSVRSVAGERRREREEKDEGEEKRLSWTLTLRQWNERAKHAFPNYTGVSKPERRRRSSRCRHRRRR